MASPDSLVLVALDGQTVAAAEHKNAFRRPLECSKRRMDKRFVTAVFVKGIELQVAVQKKGVAGFAACDHYPLIR